MNRKFISFILIGVFSGFALANSKIEICYDKIPANIATGLDKFKCKGKFTKPGLLDDIGYTDQDLAKGVTCRMADFDGDGSLDYWIYKCNSSLTTCKSKVIFVKKNEVDRVVPVDRNLDGPDIFYVNKREDFGYLKTFGCKLPSSDTLIELGDGDGRENRIYIFDQKKNKFLDFSHCTTVESAD